MLTYFVETGAAVERNGDEVAGEIADAALFYSQQDCVADDGKYVEEQEERTTEFPLVA